MRLTTNMTSYAGRRLLDRVLRGFTVGATVLAIVPLFLIIGYVLVIGGQSVLHSSFWTDTYQPPVMGDMGDTGGITLDPVTGLPTTPEEGDLSQIQAQGGVLHGIVGTLLVTLTALLLALPIGILAGIFLAEYPDNTLAMVIRFCSDVLSGAPSIVIGVVGYTLFVQQFKTYAGIAGSVALLFLMVPTIARTTEEMLKLVPNAVREAAMALGAPMWYATFTAVIPQALTGIVTGALLAFARGAGETAPLLLTIQGNNNLSVNMLEPLAALPLLTYKYIESPFPSENQLAWGAAFVLMLLVVGVNLLLRTAASRIKG